MTVLGVGYDKFLMVNYSLVAEISRILVVYTSKFVEFVRDDPVLAGTEPIFLHGSRKIVQENRKTSSFYQYTPLN